METAPETLTLKELARRLGLCERQVRNLTHRGLPRLAPQGRGVRFGLYPWPEARDWYLQFLPKAHAARAAAAHRGLLAYAARRRAGLIRKRPPLSTP